MPANDCVLLVGHDRMLLQTRRLVLESAGFQVGVVHDLAGVAESIVHHPIECFVLCQTLSAEERVKAMRLAERLRPQTRILVIEGEFTDVPRGRRSSVVHTAVGPTELIAAVRTIVGDIGQATL